jgi:hypothetical protein
METSASFEAHPRHCLNWSEKKPDAVSRNREQQRKRTENSAESSANQRFSGLLKDTTTHWCR